jgi:salicylate hydroxylase
MDLARLRTYVIGGGIGGLATALALAQRGADVTVLEQAPEITEVGAGLQISPNGFAVLAALGLGGQLAQASVQAQGVSLRDYRRGQVVALDLQRLARREYYFVHRADLIDILAQAVRAAGVRLRLLQRVEQVDVQAGTPVLILRDGTKLSADLVVGADGVHSVLRAAILGPAKPRFTGQVAWRAVVPNTQGRGPVAHVHMGPGRHVVSYPLRGGEWLNVVAVREQAEWADESWTAADDPDNLRAHFADFGPEVQGLLAQITEVRRWGLFRHPVAPRWHMGQAALLGDAAHPTLPFLAQGANMALEDAWALAMMVGRHDTLAQALAGYQALRHERACKVINAASANAWKYHLSVPPLRWAAHGALRLGGLLAPDKMVQQFGWLYGYDIARI